MVPRITEKLLHQGGSHRGVEDVGGNAVEDLTVALGEEKDVGHLKAGAAVRPSETELWRSSPYRSKAGWWPR
jgi:hypothetical protein